MKQLLKNTVPFFLASLLIPVASYASGENSQYYIASECHHTAEHLSLLAHQHPDYACFGEIHIAASHVTVAVKQIEHAKYQHAQESLMQAKFELDKVRADVNRCTYYAPKVAPFIADLVRINGELDVLERLALQNK